LRHQPVGAHSATATESAALFEQSHDSVFQLIILFAEDIVRRGFRDLGHGRLHHFAQAVSFGPLAVIRSVIVAPLTVMPTSGSRLRRIMSGSIASKSLSPTPKHLILR